MKAGAPDEVLQYLTNIKIMQEDVMTLRSVGGMGFWLRRDASRDGADNSGRGDEFSQRSEDANCEAGERTSEALFSRRPQSKLPATGGGEEMETQTYQGATYQRKKGTKDEWTLVPEIMGTPATLPANFFEKQAAQSGPPKTLPADFDFKKSVAPEAKSATKQELSESQRPDAVKQAQAVIKNTPMTPSYSAMALSNSPSGADPHNPGNPNLNAVPASQRESVNNRALAIQSAVIGGEAFTPTQITKAGPLVPGWQRCGGE